MQRSLSYVGPRYQLDARKALLAADTTTVDGAATQVSYSQREVETLHAELDKIAKSRFPAHISKISEEIACVVFITEALAQKSFATVDAVVKTAYTAWRVNARYFSFALECRVKLDNDHRRILWIARLRCIGLASNHCLRQLLRLTGGDEPSLARLRKARVDAHMETSQMHRGDPQYRAAHDTLWPFDTADDALFNWCIQNELLPFAIRKDYDVSVRTASTHTLWRMMMALLSRWMHLPYCCFLVAHVNRLLDRIADLCSYCGDAREFNQSMFFDRIESTDGSGRKDLMVNDRFLRDTEYTFWSIEVCLYRCAYVQWPAMRRGLIPPSPVNLARFRPDALERLEKFLTKNIESDQFIHFIESDFHTVFYDHVLRPGEMELFEVLHPYADRVPMACVAKMRDTDFDRYQRMYMAPPVRDVWKKLLEKDVEKSRTHPAYMLIASRIIQYYFDANCNGASFDNYHCNLEFVAMIHLRDAAATALSRAIRRQAITYGSAQHILGGTLLKNGLRHTADSMYPHPLILQCVGQYAVVSQASSNAATLPVDFPTAFLVWMREFIADRKLCGTFTNGESCVNLASQLDPYEDTEEIVAGAREIRAQMDRQRAESTNLERAVDSLDRMQIEDAQTRPRVVVFGTQEIVKLPEHTPE